MDVSELKEYYLRFKICDDHLRAKSAIKDGIQQRFCQQCGKFHPVEDFDGDKRSCRERLDKHNARRRRMREMQNMLRTTGTLDMAALEAKYGPLEDDEPKPKKPPASKSKGKSKAPTRARPAPEESLRLASAKELHAVNFPDIPSLSPADFDILGDEFLDGELEAILKLPDFPTTASGASTDARSGSSANLSPGVASMQQISSEVAINTDAAAAAAAMAECAEALAHAVPMTGMESPTPGMSAFVLPSEAEAMAALQEQEQQQQNHHPHQQQQQPCHVYVQQQVPQQQVQQLPAAAFPVNNFVVAAQTPGNGPFTATPVRIVRQFSATSSNGTLSDKGVVVTGANDVQQVVYIQDPNVPHAAGHRSNESTAFTQAGMLSSDQFVVMHQERRDPTAFDQSQMVQAAHGKRMRCSSKLFDSMQSDLAPRGFLGGSQLETIEEVEQVVVHAFNTGEYPSDEWFRCVQGPCPGSPAPSLLGTIVWCLPHFGLFDKFSDPVSLLFCSKQYLAYPIDVLMKIEERFLSLLDATVAKVSFKRFLLHPHRAFKPQTCID